MRGLYLGLTTWFIAEMIRFSISNTPEYTRGTLGLSVAPFPPLLGIEFPRGGSSLAYYVLLIVLGAATLLVLQLVVQSRIGLAFKAIREDELATESLGVGATKYKLLNFSLGNFFAGLMGSFYAHYLGILSPTPRGVRGHAHRRDPDDRLCGRARDVVGPGDRGLCADRAAGVFARL